ncbi:hypothetical protein DL93DRAFT_2167067 [Clavulina sp. PMI_390]|nr:hypothetical protein DL93DRAFT_2167067 [Clavulina sp. PMI_390]
MPRSPRATRHQTPSTLPYLASAVSPVELIGSGAGTLSQSNETHRPANPTARRSTARREKTGCWTCRLRAKKCSDAQTGSRAPPGPCGACRTLGFDCLGYGKKKPQWMKEEWSSESTLKGEEEVKKRMNNYNARSLHHDHEAVSFIDIYENSGWAPEFGSEEEHPSSPASDRASTTEGSLLFTFPVDNTTFVPSLSPSSDSLPVEHEIIHGASAPAASQVSNLPIFSPEFVQAFLLSQFLANYDTHSEASMPERISSRFHDINYKAPPLQAPVIDLDPIGDGPYPDSDAEYFFTSSWIRDLFD